MTADAIAFSSRLPGRERERDRVDLRGEDDAADAGRRARDHEDEDADARDVDARAARRLGIASGRVDVPAERRPLREERQQDEEDDEDHAGERQAERAS